MANAIIVHGKPSREKYFSPEYPGPHRANWLPWAGQRLEEKGFDVAIPEFPIPYQPDYETWVPVFEREHVDTNTVLIGHSFGAGVLLRWMSEHRDVEVDKLALVAPWLDPNRKYSEINDFQIDPHLTERCLGGVALLYSSRDDDGVQITVGRIRRELPEVHVRDIPHYGHFLQGNKMSGPEFPELLEELSIK